MEEHVNCIQTDYYKELNLPSKDFPIAFIPIPKTNSAVIDLNRRYFDIFLLAIDF